MERTQAGKPQERTFRSEDGILGCQSKFAFAHGSNYESYCEIYWLGVDKRLYTKTIS
jgi:hypothetical protein